MEWKIHLRSSFTLTSVSLLDFRKGATGWYYTLPIGRTPPLSPIHTISDGSRYLALDSIAVSVLVFIFVKLYKHPESEKYHNSNPLMRQAGIKGTVHNFFVYRSNLIFWIVMGTSGDLNSWRHGTLTQIYGAASRGPWGKIETQKSLVFVVYRPCYYPKYEI